MLTKSITCADSRFANIMRMKPKHLVDIESKWEFLFPLKGVVQVTVEIHNLRHFFKSLKLSI